jgi:hypothetical protein
MVIMEPLKPDNPYEELGLFAISKGDYQEAINLFRRSIEKRETAKSFSGLGAAYFHLGNLQKAKWAFNKALVIELNHPEALHYLQIIDHPFNQKEEPSQKRQVLFRVSDHYLEIYQDGRWKKFFFKGINIGLGLPGYFPGEYPIEKGTYLKWFEQISELKANSVRIYTIHPPSFYEALYQFNQSEKKLYLFQGIWVELPENNNFYNESYLNNVKENIRNTIDAVYGNAHIPERPGMAHGRYVNNVSSYTVAFLFGREWESCAVKRFNGMYRRKLKGFQGDFLSIENGTPFEVWATEVCDYLQSYEFEKYSLSHPVSLINWPTLDPLAHATESTYEDNKEFQGFEVDRNLCNENEDEETLDLSKIIVLKGNGFFATYHVYPYYPDFMVNDYLNDENPFLTYLLALKKQHGNQPILIAEFGVPSSRDIAHWHSRGWHHGGHPEIKQGEINGLLMNAIYQAKMAGGILFCWFDEWFKRSWLFLPYYAPSERKPLWYSSQDTEENYGLLAMYPGYPKKRVSLTGRKEEWFTSTMLYEKKDNQMVFKSNDGFDDVRFLKTLLAQHDEGFFYLFMATKGKIDFTKAHYLIGLDTCSSENGELMFPLNTRLIAPIGFQFLVHLAGRDRSRILVCKDYDKYLNGDKNERKPYVSDKGEWVIMQNKTNIRRISKDGKTFFPSRVYSMSNLRFGSLDPNHPHYDSLADFYFTQNLIEIRLPWSLIQFTDPSSKLVLWGDKDHRVRKTDGINVLVLSYQPEEDQLFAKKTGQKVNISDSLPEKLGLEDIKKYTWEEWLTPIFHTYLKASYYKYRETLSEISGFIEWN